MKILKFISAIAMILLFSSNIGLSQLSEKEKSNLLFMYEEEKLAQDVYTFLSEKYTLPVFKNISKSEKYHISLIENLLNKYNISFDKKEKGVFSNPELQKLYTKLTKKGSLSLTDALTVGATIEDKDIFDLKEYIKSTDAKDIKKVYTQLQCGSENHIRAFSGLLKKYNTAYLPQYLTQSEYTTILNSKHKRCF